MINKIRHKLCMYFMNKSKYYIAMDGVQNIEKALKYLELSTRFASYEQRNIVADGLRSMAQIVKETQEVVK